MERFYFGSVKIDVVFDNFDIKKPLQNPSKSINYNWRREIPKMDVGVLGQAWRRDSEGKKHGLRTSSHR
jgi:hypothetical protein